MVDTIRLFAHDATVFAVGADTRLGIGVLADASKCEVVEERNGAFELEMEYPITGALYDKIEFRSLIVCKPNPFDNPQAFRVYDISKPISGLVTIKAEHVSYDLAGFPLGPNKDDIVITDELLENVPFEATTIDEAVRKLTYYSVRDDMTTSQTPGGPFVFDYDRTHVSEFPTFTDETKMSVALPNTVRAVLGGDGGIVNKFDAEIKYDNFTFMLYHAGDNGRGKNNGVTISYGKNLTDLTQDENCANVYTHIYPYWHADDIGFRELPEKIIPIDPQATYTYTRLLPVDLSNEFQPDTEHGIRYPSDAQLRTVAQKYMADNKIDGKPVVNLTVSFEMLSKYPDYKNIAILEDVKLCDTVSVIFPKLGVTSTAKCIKTVYNAITGKYISIDLGEAKSTLVTNMAQQKDLLIASAYTPAKQGFLERSFWEAGQKIAGNKGGYIALYDSDNDGEPDELLITSQKWGDNDSSIHDYTGGIWRWNYQGLAFSASGYDNFPQQVQAAITNDGKISANFIRTGTLQSIEIDSGTNHQFHVTPEGAVTASDLTITGGEIKMGTPSGGEWPFHVYNNGKVVANDLHINGGAISIGDQFYVDSYGRINVYSDIFDPEDPETVLTHQKVLWTEYGGKLYARELTANGNTKFNGNFEHVIFDEVSDPELNNVFKLTYRYDDTAPVWAEAVRIAKATGITVNNFGGIDISGDGTYNLNSYNVYTGSEYTYETGDQDYPYELAGCRSFMSLYSSGFGGDDTFVGKSYWYYDTSSQGMEIDSNRRIWLGGSECSVAGGEEGTTIPYIYYAEKTTGQGTRGDTLFRLTCGDYQRGDGTDQGWNGQVTATDDFQEETFQSSNTSIGGIVQINLASGNIGIHKSLYVYEDIYLGEAESKLVLLPWTGIDQQLSTTSENPVMNKVITARMNEVFRSVSNGKALVASAITDKGVPTASDATFATMANNIEQIGGIDVGPIHRLQIEPITTKFHWCVLEEFSVTNPPATNNWSYGKSDITDYYDYNGQTGRYCEIMSLAMDYLKDAFSAAGYAVSRQSMESFSPIDWTTITPSFNYVSFKVNDETELCIYTRGLGQGYSCQIGWVSTETELTTASLPPYIGGASQFSVAEVTNYSGEIIGMEGIRYWATYTIQFDGWTLDDLSATNVARSSSSRATYATLHGMHCGTGYGVDGAWDLHSGVIFPLGNLGISMIDAPNKRYVLVLPPGSTRDSSHRNWNHIKAMGVGYGVFSGTDPDANQGVQIGEDTYLYLGNGYFIL